MFTTYILYSAHVDRYYIGYTGGPLHIRLQKHLANHAGFTGREVDWVVVFSEQFESKQLALQREKQIKNWKSRKLIEKLIQSKKD